MRIAGSYPTQKHFVEHVFDELQGEQLPDCQLCFQERAAYRWSELGDEGKEQEHNLLVCRICAGMILLIGENASRVAVRSRSAKLRGESDESSQAFAID